LEILASKVRLEKALKKASEPIPVVKAPVSRVVELEDGMDDVEEEEKEEENEMTENTPEARIKVCIWVLQLHRSHHKMFHVLVDLPRTRPAKERKGGEGECEHTKTTRLRKGTGADGDADPREGGGRSGSE
jgi:hypothetical protein